jgi:hypothetical protein
MAEPTFAPLTSNDHPAYFGDPTLDRFAAALIESMARTWVLQDRVRVLENTLIQKGVVTRDQLDSYQPTEGETVQIRAERDAFIRGVLDRLAHG